MRPILLEFQAFGSYPGREIVDFGPLSQRGLFVVTGPTGTGKTTIFDAMAYALYGKLPGARASAGRERSDHAAATTQTSVTLVFEVHGERYRVERSPQQEVPRKSGGGTTNQTAKASLMKLVGDTTESIATGATPVSAACEKLVGLGAAEFQKVVLLPQGEFSRFLIAKDADREVLLRELFTGSLYGDMTQWLKDRMNDLFKEVAGVDEQVRHQRKSADAAVNDVLGAWDGLEGVPALSADEIVAMTNDELRSLLSDLGEARSALDGRCAAAKATAEALAADAATAGELAKRFDSAAGFRATLLALEASKAATEAAAEEAERSAKARPVVEAAAELARRRTAADGARSAADALAADIAAGFDEISVETPAFDAAAVAAAVETARGAMAAEAQLLSAAAEAEGVATAAESAAARDQSAVTSAEAVLADTVEKQVALRSEIELLEPVAATATSASVALAEAERVHRLATDLAGHVAARPSAAAKESAARAAHETAMRQFVASQAPRLAQSLVAGEPCAVCGSTEHPAPAKADGEEVADYDTVTAAQAKADQARDSLGRIDSAITGLVEQLGADAQTPPEVLAERQEAARAAAASADTAVERLSVVRAELSAMESTLAAQRSSVSERKVEAATSRAVAEEKGAEAGRLAELCVDLDPTLVATKSVVIDRLGKLSARMASVTEAVTTSAAHVEFADSALGTALEGSGFDSVDGASSVVLDEAEEARRRAAREEWQTRYLESTASLGALEEQGVPAARPDTATLEQRAKEASEASDALASMRTTGAGSIATASARLDEAESVAADSAELRERYDTVRRAFSVCNGESPRLKVKLERWVLAHELDRVTRQANVHLERMTNHRFRLQRSLDSGQGLTLEVVDAHTGRQRATASLSGGEQFQASLALALGLADVISHGGTASGKQFEALFVDEGFGSLDPVALEQAIDALSMIQAAGRMVGAITHVEGMKERLHVGIEVSRLPGDRGSTLTVHP